jgi:hypothetical protein
MESRARGATSMHDPAWAIFQPNIKAGPSGNAWGTEQDVRETLGPELATPD